MDKQIKTHLEKRGVRLSGGRPAKGLLGTNGGMAEFLRWFHDDVMRFDSMEYRRRFWREASRHGHTIGDMPRTAIEFTDPRRHPYGEWLGNLVFLMLAMGVSAVVWQLVRMVDAHVRRLRRPTYYEAERSRRQALAAERRKIRRRRTVNPCPAPDALRTAFAGVRASTNAMIRFGSMLEDLECYVDNSIVWGGTDGRIVGRRGGIRQWLRENAPDLSERYKTVMKYKVLAKRFRQAVGISDPIPASAVLPHETPEPQGVPENAQGKEGKGKGALQEYCSERILDTMGVLHGEGAKAVSTGEVMAKARELLAKCEGTVTSLAAQLALVVVADFVPVENIARNGNGSSHERRGRSGHKSARNGIVGSLRENLTWTSPA